VKSIRNYSWLYLIIKQLRRNRGWQYLFRKGAMWSITLSTIYYLIYYTECFHFLICNIFSLYQQMYQEEWYITIIFHATLYISVPTMWYFLFFILLLYTIKVIHIKSSWTAIRKRRYIYFKQCLFWRVTIWSITLSTMCYLIYYTECFHFLICNDVFFHFNVSFHIQSIHFV
jgi:hypothetical protein